MSIVNKSAIDLIEYNRSLELHNQELHSTIAAQERVIADLKADKERLDLLVRAQQSYIEYLVRRKVKQ